MWKTLNMSWVLTWYVLTASIRICKNTGTDLTYPIVGLYHLGEEKSPLTHLLLSYHLFQPIILSVLCCIQTIQQYKQLNKANVFSWKHHFFLCPVADRVMRKASSSSPAPGGKQTRLKNDFALTWRPWTGEISRPQNSSLTSPVAVNILYTRGSHYSNFWHAEGSWYTVMVE